MEGFVPFPDFMSKFLCHLNIAPIQLSPNAYIYLLCLDLLALEFENPSLNTNDLKYLAHLLKLVM